MVDNQESKERKEGDPEIPIRLEDVVLYDGSLDELNAHNPREQYVFAEEKEFHSKTQYTKVVNHDSNKITLHVDESVLIKVREELAEKGYTGLVNKRISTFGLYEFMVYGTPIVREKPKTGGQR